jgi:hypothetical protein
MGEIEVGRATSPERAAATLLELAEGVGDGLTGRYLTVDDDIAALAEEAEELNARLANLRAGPETS